SAVAPALAGAAELIENGRVQLEEAALQLRATAERLQADPDRLDVVEARLQVLARLSRKHGVAPDDLSEVCAAMQRDLAALASHTSQAAAARQELAEREAAALALARELSAARHAA